MPFSLLSCANCLQRAVVLQAAQQAEKHLMGMEGVRCLNQRWEFPLIKDGSSWWVHCAHGGNGALNWILVILQTGLLLLLACGETDCKLEFCLLPWDVIGGCVESVEVVHLLKDAVRGKLGAGCVWCFGSEMSFLRKISNEAVRWSN